MDRIEAAKNLLREHGYRVFSRDGYKEGFVHLIRFYKANGGVSYSVRLCRKSHKDAYYGDRSEIAEINLKELKWKPLT